MASPTPPAEPKEISDVGADLVALLRRDEDVVGCVGMAGPPSSPVAVGTSGAAGQIGATKGTSLPAGNVWRLEERPLGKVLSLANAAWSKQTLGRIHAAWSRMEACEPTARSLADLLLVCIETIPAQTSSGRAWRWPQPLPAYKATAAHPRAYRGTQARPPARPRPDRLDLRLFASSPNALVEARRQLADQLDEAAAMLRELGYDHDRIRALPVEVDPYLGYHFGFTRRTLPSIPQTFLPFLGPLRQWRHDQRAIAHWLRLFFALDLAEDEPLRAAVLRMASVGEHARAWGELLVAEAPAHRHAFAQAAFEGRVLAQPAQETLETFFAELRNLGPQEEYGQRLHIALRELGRGVSPNYLLTGFLLAHRYELSVDKFFEHELPTEATSLAAPLLERIFDPRRDAVTTDWRRLVITWDVRSLYRACGELTGDGAEQILRHIDMGTVAPDVVEDLVRLLLSLHKRRPPARWTNPSVSWHERHRALFLQAIYRAPLSYQSRCYHMLLEMFEFSELEDDAWMERVVPLISRLCAPPFSTHTLQPNPLFWLLTLEETAPTVLGGNHETLQAIEEACSNHANGWVMTRGLYALSGRAPTATGDSKPLAHKDKAPLPSAKLRRFFADAFARYPSQALEAAAAWGAPEPEHARTLVNRFVEHPLMADDLLDLPLGELISRLTNAAAQGLHNAVPRKLRRSAAPLSSAQKERGLRRIAEALPLTRLDLLAQIAFDALGASLAGKLPRHALAYLREAEENRRPYRAFLLAYNKGHHRYRLDHPKTTEWQRKHPRVELERFARGIEAKMELPNLGQLTLAIEQDPFEVLQLGTYGRTCLQPGGIMSHSAISILLDANKQVVYARNRRGKVVARQVVAIAEEEKLVCFYVYPASVGPAMERIFAEYDEALAKHIGIEVLRDDSAYTIANILGRHFYDDTAWDGAPRDDDT